jgi:hypothetical protein
MPWKEVDEARYDEMLGVLPPALWLSKGFLVGEPFDHRTCKETGRFAPTYAAFVAHGGRFFEGPNMTPMEFRKLSISEVLETLS